MPYELTQNDRKLAGSDRDGNITLLLRMRGVGATAAELQRAYEKEAVDEIRRRLKKAYFAPKARELLGRWHRLQPQLAAAHEEGKQAKEKVQALLEEQKAVIAAVPPDFAATLARIDAELKEWRGRQEKAGKEWTTLNDFADKIHSELIELPDALLASARGQLFNERKAQIKTLCELINEAVGSLAADLSALEASQPYLLHEFLELRVGTIEPPTAAEMAGVPRAAEVVDENSVNVNDDPELADSCVGQAEE